MMNDAGETAFERNLPHVGLLKRKSNILMEINTMPELIKNSAPASGRLALAATWEAKEGEAEAVADILRSMARAVKSEPGTLLFWPHRSSANDHIFFLYELFADKAAFAAHQQTDHFKNLVLGQALPKLARRERVQFTPFQADANVFAP